MSTYVYLECLDHDPPISSANEVGQHLYDLPDIRKYVEQRKFYEDLIAQDMPVRFDSNWVHTAAHFLAQHPKCRIGIRDEYGREHPLEAEPE